MKFLGLEVGSWAEWFGGIFTALGIFLAIREKSTKLKLSYDYDGLNFNIKITNKSNFDVKLNQAYAFFYDERLGGKVISQHNNPIIPIDTEKQEAYNLAGNNSYLSNFNPWNHPIKEETQIIYAEYGFLVFGGKEIKKVFKVRLKR